MDVTSRVRCCESWRSQSPSILDVHCARCRRRRGHGRSRPGFQHPAFGEQAFPPAAGPPIFERANRSLQQPIFGQQRCAGNMWPDGEFRSWSRADRNRCERPTTWWRDVSSRLDNSLDRGESALGRERGRPRTMASARYAPAPVRASRHAPLHGRAYRLLCSALKRPASMSGGTSQRAWCVASGRSERGAETIESWRERYHCGAGIRCATAPAPI